MNYYEPSRISYGDKCYICELFVKAHAMKNKILFPILFIILLTLSSCSLVDLGELFLGNDTDVTFQFNTEGQPADTTLVNQLQAAIYQEKSGKLSLAETVGTSWSDATNNGLRLTLNDNKTYKILFWAENKDNTAYSFKEEGGVAVDYTDYLNDETGRMGEMYVLYGTSVITPESHSDSTMNHTVPLKSPMSRIKMTYPSPAISSSVTFHSLPICFDPFTDTIMSSDEADDSDDVTFTFKNISSKSPEAYYYISDNYFLTPANGSITLPCTVTLTLDEVEEVTHEIKGENAISLERGKDFIMGINTTSNGGKWSVWAGTYPTTSTLSTDPSDPNCYIIDNAEDIAWLCDTTHTATLGSGLTFKLITDIDMGHKPQQQPLQLPAGSIFDGNGHTIKGFRLTAGIFGEKAKDLTVKDLTIYNSRIEAKNANVGILANILHGTSTFCNVNVRNSNISTTKGAAGGMIGYISREEKSSREEKLDVVFENCHLYNTDITGTTKEGYFVGLLRGYDNGERLTFRSDCTAEPTNGGLKSTYIEGNEGVWISNIDFTHYNSWLGGEECYRAIVMFGENRYIPRWDGKTQVKPLLANPKYDDTPDSQVIEGSKRIMIYSAFDLAGAKSKISSSPVAIYFRENVDMYGAGTDGITYVPEEFSYSAAASSDDNYTPMFTYVDLLEGHNHTIYNMNITSGDGTITSAAFIRSTRKATETIHRNLNFHNCNVISRVKLHENEDGTNEDLAYGAIVMGKVSSASGATYRMENIHVYNSRVFALQGIGILTVHLKGAMHNCSVNDCHIENYKCEDHLEPFMHVVTISKNEVTVRSDFYSYGEVGPLAGMILGEAHVSDSHVRGTTIHAWGQDDQEANITGEGTLGKLAASAVTSMGYYLVPGRHVSTLIGDVRTKNGDTVIIEGCTADEQTICSPVQHKHSEKVPFIGQAYYVQFMDTMGTVIVDGHTLTLADCNRNTIRD